MSSQDEIIGAGFFGFMLIVLIGSYFIFRLTRWTRLTVMQALAAAIVTAVLTLSIGKMLGDATSFLSTTLDFGGRKAVVALAVLGFISFCISTALVILAVKPARWLRANWQVNVFADDAPASAAATDENQRIILDMLAAGKVSPQEAEELLKAIGEKSGQNPAVRWTFGFFISTLLIPLGFVLPWRSFFGHIAGYESGAIGWVILILGVLPAVLMCIPALDRLVQLAHLRLILAGCGFAFVCPLILFMHSHGIGIVLVLLGFAAQLLSAAAQSGLLRPRAAKAAREQ